ncbi:MAG: glycosyltransferase [Flavisolibacter sp.]
MILLLVSLLFLFVYGLLFAYYLRGWNSAGYFEPKKDLDHRFISIIVPARNEEKNIAVLLAALEGQNYPAASFEIIVVDDFSTDNTAAQVKRFQNRQIRLIQPAVDATRSSKKKAIEAGVQQARGELILTTDADCIPGPEWLSLMNAFYIQTKSFFIAAPVKFSGNKSWLHIFQSLDFISLQGITAASVHLQFHAMCNGANLSYTKKAFQEVKGFEGIDGVATGDDLLLMFKIWKKFPGHVAYLKNKKAIVETRPMRTWKEFFMQRKRWASKSLVYDDYRIIAVLIFVYLLNLWFVLLLIVALVHPFNWIYVLGFWVLKTAVEFPFVKKVAKFYDEEDLMRYFFFLQPLHMVCTVVIGIISQWGRYEWKGRKTK